MRWLLLLLLTLPLWADTPVISADKAGLPPGVVSAYHELSEAWRHLDADGVMTHFTHDLKLIDGRGAHLDFAGVTHTVHEAMKGATHCEIDYGVHSWKMEGDVCFVVVHQTRTIDYGGKKVTRVVEREDRWRQTDRGWQFCDVRFLHQVVTITGAHSSSRKPPKGH